MADGGNLKVEKLAIFRDDAERVSQARQPLTKLIDFSSAADLLNC